MYFCTPLPEELPLSISMARTNITYKGRDRHLPKPSVRDADAFSVATHIAHSGADTACACLYVMAAVNEADAADMDKKA